ncbi:uncharacterized [Tachysurus ichikawai]
MEKVPGLRSTSVSELPYLTLIEAGYGHAADVSRTIVMPSTDPHIISATNGSFSQSASRGNQTCWHSAAHPHPPCPYQE